MADGMQHSRRVELVATSTPESTEAGRVGLGLLIGLFIGRSSLMGAATGSERFEIAVAHFVGVVLVSVAGVLLLGVLWDRARRSPEPPEQADAEPPADPLAAGSELTMGPTS